MSLRTVLILMALVGAALAAFSFGLHERFVSADEPQVRHACRKLCTLQVQQAAGGARDGLLGDVAGAFAGRACEAMDDGADALIGCRDRLFGANLKVSDYRCVLRAQSLPDAERCLPE